MTNHALIGYSGFVGGNLARDGEWNALYNSKNIDDIRGKSFDLLVSAGAPAVKWLANKEPENDLAALEKLKSPLREVKAQRCVLISTVDVYPKPIDVDETTIVEPSDCPQAYGRHRLELEAFFRDQFEELLIVRLPGLYGEGLKKNVIFDLLHEKMVDKIITNARFQFYGLGTLWRDIETAMAAGLDVVNFAVEPVLVDDIVQKIFGRELPGQEQDEPALYDFRTIHASVFGGENGYMQRASEVLSGIEKFVENYQRDES